MDIETRETRPLISVVIPTYNRADTLPATLESVLRQTYQNTEILIVDDGSTDGTADLFKEITDPRIRYIYQENAGACAARNKGAEEAGGEYIAFQDSDDIWYGDHLEAEYNFLVRENADLVFCGMKRINKEKGIEWYYPVYAFDNNADALPQILKENAASTQCLLMKREVADKVCFDPEFRRFQDWDFVIRVIVSGFKVKYLDKCLVDSLVQPDSISQNVKNAEAYDHLAAKHAALYASHPEALAAITMSQARARKHTDRKAAQVFLKKSFKAEKSPKTLLKIILNRFGAWR